MNWLKGKKTYLIAVLMILVSMLHLITGDMSLEEFVTSEHVNTLLEGVDLGTLRAGISKKPIRQPVQYKSSTERSRHDIPTDPLGFHDMDRGPWLVDPRVLRGQGVSRIPISGSRCPLTPQPRRSAGVAVRPFAQRPVDLW